MNPPLCSWCHRPVEGSAVNATHARIYHGPCYMAYAATLWKSATISGIGQMNHDERVQEGLELP